jgi:XRE family transcriptional regulator, fatty acid utilization regulator
MAEQKIFAGPRIRRIRHSLGLTQTAMASELGISSSYLNLIERNQRPLTVQVLLRLAASYQIDLEELRGAQGGLSSSLKEVFADPLLATEIPSPQELIEIADATPNAAAAIIKLYRAYRESLERLSDLSDMLARQGHQPASFGKRLPFDEVRETFEQRDSYFHAIDSAAEAFRERLGNAVELGAALRMWLKERHDISVRLLPAHAMPLWRRRYDRHSMRLFLSERLTPFDQLFEIAMETCLIELGGEIDSAVARLSLTSGEGARLARFELARYAAHALMMPYGLVQEAAVRARYDIDVLRGRFGVSFEQAANRLATLGRSGRPGIPFFMLEVDAAGNRIRRGGRNGFPQARFGGQCPKLPVHAAFALPGQVLVEKLAMPDGSIFITIARTLDGMQAGFGERVRRTAIMLGVDAAFAGETVYGAAVAGGATLVGPACRVCERQGCLARAEPPITRPLGLDAMVTGLSAFDFQ